MSIEYAGHTALNKLVALVKTALAGKAPNAHASTATTYGKATSTYYGHVKLSDSTTGTGTAASGGTAATPKAVSDALSAAKSYANTAAASASVADSHIADLIYPIGSIYMSSVSTSPATLFGGTWVQLKDRFMVAAGTTYPAGSTGGAATHTHTTANHTLTVSEMPAHGHNGIYYSGVSTANAVTLNTGSASYHIPWGSSSYAGDYGAGTGKAELITGNTGGGAGHNHGNTGSASSLPPYWAVYMWERTA